MLSHYKDVEDGKFSFGDSKVSDYYRVPVKNSTNYVYLYSKDHSNNPEEEQMLTFFTQQEIRSLEQSYTTYVNPSNYKGNHVNMWHSNWVPVGDYSNMSTGKTVTRVNRGNTHRIYRFIFYI